MGAHLVPPSQARFRALRDPVRRNHPGVSPAVRVRFPHGGRCGETFAQIPSAGESMPSGSQPLGLK